MKYSDQNDENDSFSTHETDINAVVRTKTGCRLSLNAVARLLHPSLAILLHTNKRNATSNTEVILRHLMALVSHIQIGAF